MTLNEIVFNILNIGKGGILSDDNRLDEEQVKFIVNYARSVVIKRDVDKGKRFDAELIQDLGCVPVELIDKAECPEITLGCKIMRTVDKIPQAIDFNFRSGFIFVGDLDGGRQYMESDYNVVIWTQHEKYTSQSPRFFLKDGYVYVVNKFKNDFLRIRAIFEDPREAERFNPVDGEPCYNDDMDYPISSWMIPVINDMIFKRELNIVLKTENDEINDAKEGAVATG